MSTHYLVDLHRAPVTASEINDVRYSDTGQTPLGGNFIIRLPDGVSIGATNPVDLTDLLTKKYAGLLAYHAGYTRITYDALLDTTSIDMVNSQWIAASDRCGTSLAGNGTAIFQSLPTPLIGLAPSQAVVTFETFNVEVATPMSDRQSRTYQETVTGAVAAVQVSFNGGVSWLPTADGQLLNIPGPDQGTSFVFQLAAAPVYPDRVFLGSWAVVY